MLRFLTRLAACLFLAIGVLFCSRSACGPAQYVVRGVDVSAYQGAVDWRSIAAYPVDFAYIKATEGSSHRDERFSDNWAAASEAGLYRGAYHFFSYDSPGARQAEHFIATVPRAAGDLPPVVDVEFYGRYHAQPASPADVLPELRDLLDRLEEHYGAPPLLYATGRAYRLYLDGFAPECGVWIRDVRFEPSLPGRDWLLWQYTDSAILPGTDGQEKHIDMNVYYGSREQLEGFSLLTGA